MNTLKELLIQFDACTQTREWVGNKTIEEVVKECHRGDWLLYLAKLIKLPERKIISCAGHCVNTVRNLMKDERTIKLLDMCMKFEDESISFEELEVARDAALDAAIADAAALARAAASCCVDVYAARAAAAYAADACAIADDLADAAYTAADAHKENQLQTANIVRERIGQDIINKVNQLLNN